MLFELLVVSEPCNPMCLSFRLSVSAGSLVCFLEAVEVKFELEDVRSLWVDQHAVMSSISKEELVL